MADDEFELRAARKNRKRHPLAFQTKTAEEDMHDRETTPMSLAGDDSRPKIEDESQIADNTTPPSPPELQNQVTPAMPIPERTQHQSGMRYKTPLYPVAHNCTDTISQFESPKLPCFLFRSVGVNTAGLSDKRFIYSGRHAPFAGRPIHVPIDAEVALDDCELHIGRHDVHSSLIR